MNSGNTLQLEVREQILNNIKEKLLEGLKENIISVTAYGSTLNDDFCQFSDFDVLVVLEKPTSFALSILREIKEDFCEEGIEVDFNVHSYEELPRFRKEAFWHNNRHLFIQKEVALYGKQLLGAYPFDMGNYDKGDFYLEAVRVISSLNYQARKLLINKELNEVNKILMMKWCIYGVLYALASIGEFFRLKSDALKRFNKIAQLPINPVEFLKIKVERPGKINYKDLEKAYKFLTFLDMWIFQKYKLFISNKKEEK